jgi:hypothetical protein
MSAVKSGRTTTEFYLYVLVVIIGGLVASGIFDCDPTACVDIAACYCPAWAPLASKILGVLASIGAVLGYGKNRKDLKARALEADAMVEAAKNGVAVDPIVR